MKWSVHIYLLVLLTTTPYSANAYGTNKGFMDGKGKSFQSVESSDAKTLIVPRSNKIQIAFADDGSDPRTKLHMDLLRLYKQVMEEVLERNKLISTVQTLLDKVTQIDELAGRVHRLEQDLGIGRSGVGHVHRSSDNGNGDKDWSEEEYQGTTTSFAETGLGVEAEMSAFRARLHQQDKTIRRLQEDLRIQTKLTAEQGREIQRQNEHIDRLRSTTDNLERKAVGGGRTIITDDSIDNYGGEVGVLRANVATVESKLHKLTLDLQWHEFKLNMQQNSTDNIEREVEGIENTVSALYTKSGSLQTMVNQVRADSIQCKSKLHASNKKIHDIETHIEKIAMVLSRPGGKNITGHHATDNYQIDNHNHGLDTNVYGLIEDATYRMFNMIHRINNSHHHLILSDRRQQKQLDEISLDVESLKDEMDDYFAKLRDLDTQAAELKDSAKGSRRDREKIKRKLERIQRDMNVVMSALNAHGMTTEPSHVVRRTTQPRTLVTRDVTMPDVTRTYVTPSTRSRSLTADPLLRVTNSPNGPEDRVNDDEHDMTTEEGTDSNSNHLVVEPNEHETSPTTLLPDKTSEYNSITLH